MAEVQLRFSKTDNTPWGFRLTGGTDFGVPLQVVKVSKGSIAESAGMQLGDILVRIDRTDTADLTHIQAHDVILNAGGDFTITVIRGELSEETKQSLSQEISVSGKQHESQQICIESMESEVLEQQRETMKISGKLQTEIELSVQIQEEEFITEEEMEQESSQQLSQTVISGQVLEDSAAKAYSEASKESQIIAEEDIDLQKFIPKVEFVDSETLKVLKESATETKEKKWSTFLQKPARPRPKDKKQEEEKSKEPPYRVVIVKGKKKEAQPQKPKPVKATEDSAPTDQAEATPEPELDAEIEQICESPEDVPEERQDSEIREQDEDENENENEGDNEPVVSETEMSLEDQLAAVQRQLLALSQLPAAIQQTLDVVTSQLAKIVGPVNQQTQEEEEQGNEEDNEYQQDDYENELDILDEIPEEGESDNEAYQVDMQGEEQEDGREERIEEQQPEPEPEIEKTPEPELTEEEKEVRRIEQEKENKKQKDQHLLEDLRQRRIKERPSYPLTPLERPIFLPGGRRWKMPGDACPEISNPGLSDDMIAETISSQTEVITGTTLGINFLKYQPKAVPLDHLRNSETYRLVHDMEPEARGIPARPAKPLAEEDYYTQIQKEGTQQHDALNK